MPPRASWKGQLKLSLVNIPIRMYNAVSSSARISFNQLHKDCHQRVKNQLDCPEHGNVPRSEIVKGYEYEKGKYVVVDEADLEHVRLETTKTIDVEQFVDADELDPIYLNTPYYVAPDGPVAQEAFAVIREAMVRSNKTAIARVVLVGREHLVAIKPQEDGFLLTTLRYNAEVRSASSYFEDIDKVDLPEDQLALAEQLIDSKTSPLDTSVFADRYQDALLEVIKAKLEGSEPVMVQEDEAGKVINFMDALKQSVGEQVEAAKGKKKKPPAGSVKKSGARKKKKIKGA